MARELRKYSTHESGHAIFNWLNSSSRLVSVSISKDGLNNTTVVNHPVFKILHKISHEHMAMKSWVGGLLAGVAGEMHLDNVMWDTLPTILEPDVRMAMQAMQSRGWAPPKGYTCDQFFKDWGSWARTFTVSRWREISLLSDELERKFRLSGIECARFLEDIWPEPLPQGVLRYWEHKA